MILSLIDLKIDKFYTSKKQTYIIQKPDYVEEFIIELLCSKKQK